MAERFYEAAELAARWHCSLRVIRQNRVRWGLRGFKVGKKLIFPEAEVAAVERRWEEGGGPQEQAAA
jgi:hypothetical protein